MDVPFHFTLASGRLFNVTRGETSFSERVVQKISILIHYTWIIIKYKMLNGEGKFEKYLPANNSSRHITHSPESCVRTSSTLKYIDIYYTLQYNGEVEDSYKFDNGFVQNFLQYRTCR